MTINTYYKVGGQLLHELPTDPNVEYEKWLRLSADEGYVLQNIFTYRTTNRILLRAGFETFWKEILLGAVK